MECGGATQSRSIICVRNEASGASTEVTLATCGNAGLAQPATQRACNADACKTANPVYTSGHMINVDNLGVPLATRATRLHRVDVYISKIASGAAVASAAAGASTGVATGAQVSALSSWAPGTPATWQAGTWSSCKAAAAASDDSTASAAAMLYGTRTRSVACVDVATGDNRDESACFSPARPVATAGCAVSAGAMSAVCRVPGVTKPCSGAGSCADSAGESASGCKCAAGVSGTLCQVPADCGTAVDARMRCCDSGRVEVSTGARPALATLLFEMLLQAQLFLSAFSCRLTLSASPPLHQIDTCRHARQRATEVNAAYPSFNWHNVINVWHCR